MGVTYNRRPVSTPVPSSNDAKHYFFNHYNWKGINQNRNFLAVDQETFEDSDNIYVDDENLLKSRPPLRQLNAPENKKIKDFEVLGDIIICTYYDENSWFIGVIKSGTWIMSYEIISYYPLRAFRSGNYIYIFVSNGVLKYDVDNNIINNNCLYVPITRIYNINNFETYEEDNIFSGFEKHRHLIYSTIDSEDISQLISSDKNDKSGTYEYYIDSKKFTNDIYIDSNNKFLGYLHQPLSYNYSDYYTDYEVFGHKVINTVYHNKFLYRFVMVTESRGKLMRASISDMVFEDLLFIDTFQNDELRKIKILEDDVVIITTYDVYHYNTLTGELTSKHKLDVIDTIEVDDFSIDVGILDVPKIDEASTYEYLGIRVSTPNTTDYIHLLEIDELIPNNEYDIQVSSTYFKTPNRVSRNSISVGIQVMCKNIRTNTVFNDVVIIMVNLQDGISLTSLSSRFGTYVYDEERLIYKYVRKSNYIDFPGYGSLIPNVVSINDETFSYVLVGKIQTGQSYEDLVSYNSGYQTENFTSVDNCEYYVDKHGLYESGINGLYLNHVKITTLIGNMLPIFDDYWSYAVPFYNVLLSNYRISTQSIDFIIEKESEYFYPEVLNKNDKIFISKNNNLVIGEFTIVDNVEMLYFKKSYKHVLDYDIKNFHKISEEIIAIFTEHGTWYSVLSDNLHYYYKSKIVPVLKGFSDITTLPDSTTTLLPSPNGIIALSYQNFVNNSEQSTVNITDNITTFYKIFTGDVKIINWKQYIFFYEYNNNTILILDVRNNSWWKWTLPINIDSLFLFDNELYVLSNGNFYKFYNDSNLYFDFIDDKECTIDWYVESQKLHLNANNHYKHIVNLTLASVQEDDLPIHLNLNVNNYRKHVDNGKAENFDYNIDVIRTYVKRLNYAKVCEFQYRLSSDSESAINVPLALSNITIKYKIGGQVR